MQIEEIKFINDVIQDTRAYTRIEQAYDMLIGHIIDNSKLDWNKTGLILKSDEKLFTIIELLEPVKFKNKLEELQEQEKVKEKKE